MKETVVGSLPLELLEKIIIPFGDKPENHLVCKLWFEFCEDLIQKANKKHKANFKNTLDEIRSIRYELIILDNIIIGYHPIEEDYISELIDIRSGNHMSVRQYKNKVAVYFSKNKSICHKKVIVNKIKMMSFKAQTIYYEYVDNLDGEFNDKVEITNKCQHQYDSRFYKSYGIIDGIYGSIVEPRLKKIQYRTRAICPVFYLGTEKYSKYHCLLKR